jgi:hypothetical protein
MRFDQLRIHDAVLAIVVAAVVIAAGASYRTVLAKRFAAPRAPAPIAEVKPAPPPPPVRPARVITKAPAGATLFAQPGSTTRPIAQIKAGAVVGATVPCQAGWCQVRSQAGTDGWASEDSLVPEAASVNAVALFDSAAQAAGKKVTTPRSGGLYAGPALTERIGGFARGEQVEILRSAGRALLVAASDGAGGRIVAYAKLAEVRSVAAPRPTPVDPYAGVEGGDPLADRTGSARGEPPSADARNAAWKDAQDQYAGGNFSEAQAKAEEAVALGSSDALVIAAMSSCKLGDLDKATRYAKKLRGAKLARFKAACSAPKPQPPSPADQGSAQPPTTPADDVPETP